VSDEKPKLFCIDDEPAILESLVRLLGRDFEVASFTSPRQALEKLQSTTDIAIVLTDHRMPEMTGLQFLSQVKQISPATTRALLSGQIDMADMVEAINQSLIHRFIVKPWENQYLRLQMLESLANYREKKRIEVLAVTDPVTLLKNHRYFQDQLKIEVERAVRHQRSLSLIMTDIDHFKKFNDQHGHPAGDFILKSVAGRLLEGVRGLDTVARYGGEEFVVILPDTSFENALVVSERLRASFENKSFPSPDSGPVSLTISLGVASTPLHTDDANELIAIADAALYRAKRLGRNQSIGAEGSSPVD
jgi:two-component system cell cycle response regulator